MSELKKSFWITLKEYSLISLGLLCYVAGWSIFLIPNNLIGGGASGLSAIIFYATGIPMGYSYFAINLVLLLLAFKIMGTGFGSKSIYAIIFTSVLLNVVPPLIPEYISQELAVSNGKMLCTIIGGVMTGVGIGMSISQGGNSGGTDILALIISKYRNVSPGRLILLMDVVIILSSLIFPSYYVGTEDMVPFPEKLATSIYGLILITVNGYAIDLYISGTKQSVQVFIFSKKYAEIADAVTKNMGRGVTRITGEGWYTKSESDILMILARKTDLNLLLRYVKSIDPKAFLSVSNVMGVYGLGFDALKGGEGGSRKRKHTGDGQ